MFAHSCFCVCVNVCCLVQGYSFIAPSILFKRNVVMDDPVQLCGEVERPVPAAVARSAMMKVTEHRPFLLVSY